MAILNQEKRAELRQFFDYDKGNVFELFMRAVQDRVRRKPAVGPTEWDTLVLTITRESEINCISQLLQLLEQEMADQEVENAK